MPPFAIDPQPSDSAAESPINAGDLTRLADGLFRGMLGATSQQTVQRVDEANSGQLMAAIRIAGNWNATLQVCASMQLARHIACAMFAQAPDVIGQDDLCDALGEVVNVLGGNVKGMVGHDCHLSLPCVGVRYHVPPSDGLRLDYDICGHNLVIVLAED